jgi:hypothetical protein
MGPLSRRRPGLVRSQISLLRRLWWEGSGVRIEPPKIRGGVAMRICPELMPRQSYGQMLPHPAERCDGQPGELSLRCRQPAGEQRGAGCA